MQLLTCVGVQRINAEHVMTAGLWKDETFTSRVHPKIVPTRQGMEVNRQMWAEHASSAQPSRISR